jgi:ribosomal protein L11 methyltransferase
VSDHRYFISAPTKPAHSAALDLLDAAFEDEGYPIATMEMDEDTGLWEASVYAPGDPDGPAKQDCRLHCRRAFQMPRSKLEPFGDVDWIAKSLEGLKPVRAGRFLVHGSHDRDAVRPNDLAIELEAGQAFGTGHHGTTAGCLEMIETVMRASPGGPRGQVLRCSISEPAPAFLAIAAAMLGPVRVLATDIDPVATRVAR